MERGNGHLLPPFDNRPNDREPLPYLTYSMWTRAAHCRRVDTRQHARGGKWKKPLARASVQEVAVVASEAKVAWTRLEWQDSEVERATADGAPLEMVAAAVASTRRDMAEQLARARTVRRVPALLPSQTIFPWLMVSLLGGLLGGAVVDGLGRTQDRVGADWSGARGGGGAVGARGRGAACHRACDG